MKKLYHLGDQEKFFEEGQQPEGWILGASNRRRQNITKRLLGRTTWNKGLTKETDDRMLKISIKEKENILLYGHNGCFGYTGDLNFSKDEEVRLKIKQSNTGKTHTEESKKKMSESKRGKKLSIDKLLIAKQKEYETKKHNNSFNISKPEEDYYEYHLTSYDKDDIIRQYRSEKYHCNCDFYIKSQDLYIECNYSWVHGPHPFNIQDEEDKQLLEEWKLKSNNSNYYKQAIYIWTDLDARKQQIARENNLNYKLIY